MKKKLTKKIKKTLEIDRHFDKGDQGVTFELMQVELERFVILLKKLPKLQVLDLLLLPHQAKVNTPYWQSFAENDAYPVLNDFGMILSWFFGGFV